MKIIEGNLLEIEKGVMVHQVNCQKIAGAGLALQIRNKWPQWYKDFILYPNPHLGNVQLFHVREELWIANLYAQDRYGKDGKCYTDYQAFGVCLKWIRDNLYFHGQMFYFPYKIGCGWAGGDWNIISGLIEKELPEAMIVRLPNG